MVGGVFNSVVFIPQSLFFLYICSVIGSRESDFCQIEIKKGIRCKSGAVPVAVSSEKAFSLQCHCLNIKDGKAEKVE